MTNSSNYRYVVGGPLRFDERSYIKRQVDDDLYKALKEKEFCYVLNARQMGKSSLRNQMERRLNEDGTSCGLLDFSVRDKSNPESWYISSFNELVNEFHLNVDLSWWTERKAIPPVQRLSNFIEKVLLPFVSGNIVIFVDEIDNVLSLPFGVDEFFGLIRACYNRRADRPEYHRLTFAMFGVATPSDLIQDKLSTPFNIGQAIQLSGFQPQEAKSLAIGLIGKASVPEVVLDRVLEWTNGQPFLTQLLCKLIQFSSEFISAGEEAEQVEQIVRSGIIQNWDSPGKGRCEHLIHIRDRIFADEQQTILLLGLYQQLLRQETVTADPSPEKIKLCLSGLAIEQNNRLSVYNRIYAEVFNQSWVAEALLEKRRLYGKALANWVDSNSQDDTWLLDELALKNALEWAKDKHLSNEDQQFLTASANRLNRRKLKRLSQWFSYLALLLILVLSLIFVGNKLHEARYQTERLQADQLVNQAQVASSPRISTLLALEAMQRFKRQGRFSPDAAQVIYHQLDVLPRWLRTISHPSDVETVTFSRTGSHLISTSLDSTANRLDVSSGAIKPIPRFSKATVIAFSSDDEAQLVAVANDSSVQIRKTKSQKLIQRLELQAYVNAMAFSPDRKFIAIAMVDTVNLNRLGEDRVTAQIREITSGKLIASLNHGNSVNALAFSPDGKWIVTASEDGTAQVWETMSGKPVGQSLKHQGTILDVVFSTDGKYVATASLDKSALIWEVGSDQLPILLPHEKPVTAVSLSYNRKWVVTASTDKIARVWDLTSGNIIAFIPHKDFLSDVAFAPNLDNETLIATASLDDKVRLWRIGDNSAVTRLVHNHPVTAISFNARGDRVTTVSSDRAGAESIFQVWDATGGQKLQPQLKFKSSVDTIAVTSDGQLSAIASSDLGQAKTTVRFWNTNSKNFTTLTISQNKRASKSITLSQNKKFFALAYDDNTVQVWKMPNDRELASHSKLSVKASKDSFRQFFLDSSVEEIALSPEGLRLVIVGFDNTATLWDVTNNRRLAQWDHETRVNTVSFSSQGHWIATASDDNKVKIFQKDGQQHCSALQHEGGVITTAFSRNEAYLVTGTLNGQSRIWNVENCQDVASLNHAGKINAVTFSADDRFVATASDDKTARVWERSTGQEVVRLDHEASVNDVAFNPVDNRQIATASSDMTAKIWFWQLEDLRSNACQHITDDFTQKERKRYIIDESDRQICPTQ
jgi:WD40 repeat protein